MIHQLKIESKYFEDIASGKKTFEVRNNDRNFIVGDFLALNELNKTGEHKETGRCCLVFVTYILDDPAYCKEGYVVLGLEPCSINVNSVGDEAEVYEPFVISE